MEPRREEYRGHVIELREPRGAAARAADEGEAAARAGGAGPDLLIDGVAVGYGRLPDGSYALRNYAYDWTGDLVELARRLIDYESGAR